MLARNARAKERERERRNGWKRDTKHFFTLEKATSGTSSSRGVERTDDGVMMVDRWSIKARPVYVERKITKTRRSVGREE